MRLCSVGPSDSRSPDSAPWVPSAWMGVGGQRPVFSSCCCQSFAVWAEASHSSYLLQEKLRKEAKKKRLLVQEWISCVSVHKVTLERDRKRSVSLQMCDLYLAATLYNGKLIF